MSVKQKAVDDIKKFAKMFSGFLALAEDIQNLDSIDHAIEESKMRLEIAKKVESEALVKETEAKEAALVAQFNAAEIEISAKVAAQLMMDEMKSRVASMKEAAELHVKEVNKACDEAKAKSEMQLKEAGASLVEIVIKRAETQKALDELSAQLKELRARLVI